MFSKGKFMTIHDVQKSPHLKKLRLFGHIFCPILIAELKQRRIPETLAAKYLQQICLQDSLHPSRKLNAFAFANDHGGYAVSIPGSTQSLTTSLHPHSPTTFKAKNSKKVFVFEEMWDFLSWMEMQDTPEPVHNIIVLNSPSFYSTITGQIIAAREQIDTVTLFLPNNDAAAATTDSMSLQLADANFNIYSMAGLYKGYKNLSDYWRKDPSAKKITERKEVRMKYYTDDSAWNMVMNKNGNLK